MLGPSGEDLGVGLLISSSLLRLRSDLGAVGRALCVGGRELPSIKRADFLGTLLRDFF
jgi:hypothetical protein